MTDGIGVQNASPLVSGAGDSLQLFVPQAEATRLAQLLLRPVLLPSPLLPLGSPDEAPAPGDSFQVTRPEML